MNHFTTVFTKLVASASEECHTRAWEAVKSFMQSSAKIFAGASLHGMTSLMPEVSSWCSDTLADTSDVRENNDHMVFIWCNLTTAGIVSAGKWDFVVGYITNELSKHKRNSIAIVVHPNRAGQFKGGAVKTGGGVNWIPQSVFLTFLNVLGFFVEVSGPPCFSFKPQEGEG